MTCICPVAGAGLRRPDPNVSLHLRFDNELNTFYDLAGNSLTPSGDVTQTATQAKFVGKSGYFDGTGDKITIQNSSRFNFGAVSWSIEMQIYPTGTAAAALISCWAASNYGWTVALDPDTGNIMFYHSINGTSWASGTPYWVMGDLRNKWTHFKLVRYSGVNNLYCYVNGGLQDLKAIPADSFYSSSANIIVGSDNSPSPYIGYIDELIVRKYGVGEVGLNPTRRK